MARNRLGRKTSPGFADHAVPVMIDEVTDPGRVRDPRLVRNPAAAEPQLPSKTPLVEIEVTHQRGRCPRLDPVKRTYEIWTQNTVYAVDSKLTCIEVRSPGADHAKAEHPFLGARLVGGQVQGKTSVEMSYPLPRPGSVAVFESRKGSKRHFSRTSRVERVVLRVCIVTITDGNELPSWDDVVGV